MVAKQLRLASNLEVETGKEINVCMGCNDVVGMLELTYLIWNMYLR